MRQQRVSVIQAACNALAAWLVASLTNDIVVFTRWPEANVKLPAKAVSIIKTGKRQRLDIRQTTVADRKNLSATTACITFQIGAVTQTVQLDVWAATDVDRDDIIAQLDDALTAGQAATGAGTSGMPVRDGVLVPMLAEDSFTGNAEFVFDEPEMPDTPDSIQRAEFRAMYTGEVRCGLTTKRTTNRMIAVTLKAKVHEAAQADPGSLYDTTTQTPSGRTHGQSP